MSNKKYCHAFTLIEVLVVIVMITILVAIALPSYSLHLKRARYLSLVTATTPFKIGVEECFALLNSLDDCESGHNGVPPALSRPPGHGIVQKIAVSAKGIITASPYAIGGILNADLYRLTPIIIDNELEWQPSGPGVLKGYAN